MPHELPGKKVPEVPRRAKKPAKRRTEFLKMPEYLNDLLQMPARRIQRKWGVSQSAVNNHQHMSGDEILQRIAELES